MTHRREERANGIRCRFNSFIEVLFKEQRSVQTLASFYRGKQLSVLGSTLPFKKCFSIQGTCNKSNTVVMTLCVNVSIKSQQAMKTAMTPLSFARIRPFVSLWIKTTLMRQGSQYGFPLPGGEGYSLDDGFCDFAFGSTQNDRMGGILRKVKVFRSENLTKRKSGAICIGL